MGFIVTVLLETLGIIIVALIVRLIVLRIGLRKAAAEKLALAPKIKYPHILKATLLTVGGSQKAATVKVYHDVIYICIGITEEPLAALAVDTLQGVIYQDLTRDGQPMAGLGILTPDGQYKIFSHQFYAPSNLKRTAAIIAEAYNELTGLPLPYVNPDEECLHTRS